MTLAPREESTEGWEPEQLLILCWLQTEVQAVSKVLLLHNEHIYPSLLCSDEGLDPSPLCASWLATPPSPHQLLPIVELYCRAGGDCMDSLCIFVYELWWTCCYQSSEVHLICCLKRIIIKKKKATAARRLALNQVTFVFHGHRSSAEMQCGINRVEVFTQLRLRHAPRQ